MTTSGRDLRIGDAEREDATTLLQQHLGAGRLGHDEFDARVHAALRATHTSQLMALFDDLPGRRPGQGLAPVPVMVAPAPRTPPRAGWWRRVPAAGWVLGGAAAASFALIGFIIEVMSYRPAVTTPPMGRGHGRPVPRSPFFVEQPPPPLPIGMFVALVIMILVMLGAGAILVYRTMRDQEAPQRR